ncbi:hypothetical protein TorRG33x02_100160 [Trema orientale]|uniref:NAA35-like TPR repeats domain-containing protein n=1 Tax=Trema orientale TaxID=63057 RepID=A0A2P5F933_TREOI|nr:hypothetical protein TorRG33x02_100160 [Trema orientale]
MLAALRNEHGILETRSSFNAECKRFIQHFELLQKANIPDHVSYPSFEESTTYAEHNNIALNVISRVGTLHPFLKVSFEFNNHPYFATAVFKSS